MGYLHEAEDELVLHGYSEKNKRINYSIDIIKLDNRIENEIIRLFNKFNDLAISCCFDGCFFDTFGTI